MHVLVLPSWFENPVNPTSGSFFKDQAIAIKQQGCKVGIIFPIAVSLKKTFKFQQSTDYVIGDGIPVFNEYYFTLPRLRQVNISRRLGFYFRLFERYCSVHGVPDILHAHSCSLGPFGSAGIAAAMISEKTAIPFVITEHASAFRTGYFKPEDVLPIKRSFQNAGAAYAVSESLCQDLVRFGIESPIKVLGNVIDCDAFNPVERKTDTDTFTFIVVAYLRPIKGIDTIIRAFAEVCGQSEKPINLKIVGNGEQRQELENLSLALGLQGKISFLGELSREKVSLEMSTSHCYLSYSVYETFSVVIHEALCAGIKVISSPCGGPEATLRLLDQTVLSERSQHALTEAMLESVDKPLDAAEQKSNATYVKTHFSSMAIGEKLMHCFTDLCSHSGVNK